MASIIDRFRLNMKERVRRMNICVGCPLRDQHFCEKHVVDLNKFTAHPRSRCEVWTSNDQDDNQCEPAES